MKIIIIGLILQIGILQSWVNSSSFTMHEGSLKVYETTAHIARKIEKKYDLVYSGIGSAGCGEEGFTSLSLNFHMKTKYHAARELRQLVIEISQIFLNEINSRENIRSYLKPYPFAFKNINVTVFNPLPSMWPESIPYLNLVSAEWGELEYYYILPNEDTYHSFALEKIEEPFIN